MVVAQSKNTRKQNWFKLFFSIFREIQVDHWYTMEFKLGWRLLELLLDVKLVIHQDLQESVTSEIGFWPTQEYELFKIQNKNNFYRYVLCINLHLKILKYLNPHWASITRSVFFFFNFSKNLLCGKIQQLYTAFTVIIEELFVFKEWSIMPGEGQSSCIGWLKNQLLPLLPNLPSSWFSFCWFLTLNEQPP